MDELESSNTTSLFKGFHDKSPISVSLTHVFDLLVGNQLQDATEKFRYYRSIGLNKDADREKRSTYCFTPSVICKGGHAKKNVTHYTGRCMADFDKMPSEQIPAAIALLREDPYVELAYVTISGKGVRVVYRTDVTDIAHHRYAFQQGNDYFSRRLGFPADPQCCDVARTSVLCKDSNAHYCPHAKVMAINQPAMSAKKRVGRPVKKRSAMLEQALPVVLDQLSLQGKAYEEGRCNEYVSTALYLMNGYGVAQEEATAWATEQFADYGEEALRAIARSVYTRTEEHGTKNIPAGTKTDESYYASVEEIEQYVATQARIRFDILSYRREICMAGEETFRYITDNDENTLWLRAKKEGLHTSNRIFMSILNSEFIERYHPFRLYIDSHPAWDGETDYIGRVAAMIHTECQEYFNEVFRKWMVAMVASILNPEVVNHTILTFIGAQGIYKTTFFNRLLPPEMRSYFCTRLGTNHIVKDDVISLSNSVLTCLEEIDDLSSSSLNKIKAMVTLPEVNERAAYARNRDYRPHTTSFCATGNNRYFLPDDGENRRWLPFQVCKIDDPYTHPIPYEGLYAQAVALYESGFVYWFEAKEMAELTRHNQQFIEPCLEEDLIHDHYRIPRPEETPKLLSVATIMMHVGAGLKNVLSKKKLSQIMDKLGFERGRVSSLRGFWVMELSTHEKSINQRSTENGAAEKPPMLPF